MVYGSFGSWCTYLTRKEQPEKWSIRITKDVPCKDNLCFSGQVLSLDEEEVIRQGRTRKINVSRHCHTVKHFRNSKKSLSLLEESSRWKLQRYIRKKKFLLLLLRVSQAFQLMMAGTFLLHWEIFIFDVNGKEKAMKVEAMLELTTM